MVDLREKRRSRWLPGTATGTVATAVAVVALGCVDPEVGGAVMAVLFGFGMYMLVIGLLGSILVGIDSIKVTFGAGIAYCGGSVLGVAILDALLS